MEGGYLHEFDVFRDRLHLQLVFLALREEVFLDFCLERLSPIEATKNIIEFVFSTMVNWTLTEGSKTCIHHLMRPENPTPSLALPRYTFSKSTLNDPYENQ